MHKHTVWPLHKTRLTLELDQLSGEGWEFLAWFDPAWTHAAGIEERRYAIFRRPAQPQGDDRGPHG